MSDPASPPADPSLTPTTPPISPTEGAPPAAFYETWAPELKESQTVLRHKTPEDLARSLVAAEKHLGVPAAQLMRLPTKPDDVEGFKAIYSKLGAPETADGYKIDLGEGATDADKAMATDFAKAMHAAGPFPPQFLAAATAWWTAQGAAQTEAAVAEAKQATDAGTAELKTEWGQAFEVKERQVGALLLKYGGQELVDELNASPIGDSPKLAKALVKIAEAMAEPGIGGGGDPDVGGQKLTPGQAKAKRLEIESHAGFRDKGHSMHPELIRQRNELLAMEQG